ncbi:MAG: N-acetylmuramoyl-L-alanine amidase [Chitinophagaceae bacterium]
MLFNGKKAYPQAPNLPWGYPRKVSVNYIRSWELSAPVQEASSVAGRPLQEVRQTTQYVDGLGRPLQTVVKQGSMETGGTAADLVSAVVYDPFGREAYKYLPFGAGTTGGNSSVADGGFKLNPFEQQAAFMTAQYGSQGETYFYSKTTFDGSPLNRVTKTMAPGNSWAGSGRGIETKYWLNTAADEVKRWSVTGVVNGFGNCTVEGTYPGNVLFKEVSVDEHGKQVIGFKDKEGRLLLKKVQLTATADDGTGRNNTGWLCTYYIYDVKNNLRCVIQPEGVKALPGNGWQLTPALAAEQCFRYEYDQRGRMIRKKVPGAGEVYMVYDRRDRLVMIQDAGLRAQGNWLVTKYDALNRPVETGLWTDATPFSTHLANAAVSSSYPSPAAGYEELSKTFYDSYNWLSNYGNPLPSVYNNGFDTYLQAPSSTQWPFPQANIQSGRVRGLPTGSRVKVLGTSLYLCSVSFYDDKGRVIQVQAKNSTGGTDIITTQYTWSGQPLVIVQQQQKQGTNAQETVVATRMNYDDLGRVTTIEKKISNSLINGGAIPADWKITVLNQYDKLGQLKKKTLSPQFGAASPEGIETENFEYNIRGWLLGMNRDYARDQNNTNYFGFDLGYDKTNNNLVGGQRYTAAQYNGNISGMLWKSRGDGEKRKYDYSYDPASRLLRADFSQYTGGTFNQAAGVNFDVWMGDGQDVNTAYDANGNILQLQQWGLKITGSTQIDNLFYLYQPGSNKLARVTETATGGTAPGTTGPGDFKDGNNTGTDDYSYDVNGNLGQDNNKAISSITYNHLNLPTVITVTGKGTITYTYDAAGNKLSKTVNETGRPAKTTLYIAGAVYQDDTLQFISHEEGRIRPLSAGTTGWAFDYMLRDHLGNVRMVLTDEQRQDKYPVATLEDVKQPIEQQYYSINSANIVAAATVTDLPDYTNDNGIGNNPADPAFSAAASQKLYRLNSTTGKTGLGITLKVMAGDRIDIFGRSYYFQNNTGGNAANTSVPVLELLSGLLAAPGSATAGAHTSTAELNSVPAVTTPLAAYQGDPARNNSNYPQRPRAFINYIFLDEQFRPVSGNAGFSAVSDQPGLKDHMSELQNKVAARNGYVYIYISNESPVNVFFDNLQVVHTRGPVLEETHYYPFGLTMAGISSKSINFGRPQNKMKFNGIEQNTELELDIYDARYRNLDPQIGRFWQLDPKPNEIFSLYTAMANNPILYSDPLGDTTRVPRTVVLDPGHGGNDGGAPKRAGNRNEADINLIVVNNIRARLKSYEKIGNIVLTRNKDENPGGKGGSQMSSLRARVQMSKENLADYFVSIHVNSSENSGADYVRVYTKKNTNNISKELQHNIIEGLKESTSTESGVSGGAEGFYQIKNQENDVAAVLVEIGFITNPAQEKLMNDDTYLLKLGNSIADGIYKTMFAPTPSPQNNHVQLHHSDFVTNDLNNPPEN